MSTEADRELIRSIQERVGVDQTGVVDSATLMAIDETLAIARKLFVEKYTAAFNPPLPSPKKPLNGLC